MTDPAEPGGHAVPSSADCALPGQAVTSDAERVHGNVGTSSEGADPHAGVRPRVAAEPVKLALAEDDLDWDGDAAQHEAHGTEPSTIAGSTTPDS